MPHRENRGEYQSILYAENGGEDYDEEIHRSRSRGRKIRRRTLAVVVTILVLAVLVAMVVLVHEAEVTNDRHKQPGVYTQAAVAADSTLCSEVGVQIIKQGGNAVDTAIAALLCSSLTSPQSMGLGGGFFMTIYNSTNGKSTTIDSRETAPGKATKNMFDGDPDASSTGPLSIAVPSELKGYWYAHNKYGNLPWKDLFEPTIKMAAEGFPVPIGLAKAIVDAKELLSEEPSLKVFTNTATGELYKEGEIMTRPQLAETMKVLAAEGVDAFYNGSLTDSVMQDLGDIGAIITREDLTNYKVNEKEPIKITLKSGVSVLSLRPPASGAVLSFILNILDGYNMTGADIVTDKQKTLTYHRIIESFKFAYAKRSGLGDEDFVDVEEIVKNLTSVSYANDIRQLITDNTTHGYQYYEPDFYTKQATGTSHLSVLDTDGSAVSVTSTINGRFGSKRRGMRTGIIWNNEMDDFSAPNITNEWGVPPAAANFIEPGKRPLSSMVPVIFLSPSGMVVGVLGAAGGTKITTATAWVAAHTMWMDKSIKDSVEMSRLHHQLFPPTIQYETGFDETIIKNLQNLGHNVTEFTPGASIVQGIRVDPESKLIYAASDSRKGGTPDGF